MQLFTNIKSVLKSELRAKSYFKQVLYSYILISCVTFLIFSVLILIFLQEKHNQELQAINEQNIEQAYSFNSTILQDIYNYSYNMQDNITIRQVLYGQDYDTTTAWNARNLYDDFLKTNSLIASLDFINYSTQTVLSKTGRFSFVTYPDQELLRLLNTISPQKTPILCYPRVAHYPNNSATVLSMIFYSDSRGAMIINIDYERYLSLLNISEDNNTFQMILLNRNAQVIASSDDSLFGTDFSANPIYQAIHEQLATTNTIPYSDESGKYSVSYKKTPNMGITYISIYSKPSPFEGDATFAFVIKNSIIYLLITLLLSFLSSYIVYNPIKKLKQTLSNNNHDVDYIQHTHTNDFEFLESIYKNLVDSNLTLHKSNQKYQQANMEQLILKLLASSTNNPSVITSEQLERIDTYFEYLNYVVFLVKPTLNPDITDSENDLNTIRFVIMNVTTELMEPYAQIKVVENTSQDMIFICNFESYNKEILTEIVQKMQNFFHNINLFQLSIGFGMPVTELENLAYSYETAKAAMYHAVLNGYDSLVFYEDLEETPLDEQDYPYEIDKEIISSLKAQNMDNCELVIKQFFQKICNYEYHQFQRCALQLDATFRRYEHMNEIESISTADFSSLLPSPNLHKLQAHFIKRCRNNISALIEIKVHSSGKNELIQEINDYIEENIFNPNLSVSMIAEKVNLSVNYLRNIYKENTNESLTAYISQRKLALICEMLADKDMPIQDISDKLGFTTKNYFFTFFKKHMNMTPTQYRSSLDTN